LLPRRNDLRLVDRLERVGGAALPVLDQLHVAEGALAQRRNGLQVVEIDHLRERMQPEDSLSSLASACAGLGEQQTVDDRRCVLRSAK